MGYTIEVSESRKFLRVRPDRPITAELARQWAPELQELGRRHGIQRYLFDARSLPNVSSVTQNYTFAYKDADTLKLQRDVRSAILVSPDDASHNFVEIPMDNAGYSVRIFTDECAAVKWLEEETRQ